MLGRKQSNILVIKTDGLAAFVAADPVMQAIRDAHPKARISFLTTPGLQRIARASPYFDQVAALPDLRDREARKDFIRQVKASKFELVYDLSNDEEARRLRGAMGPFGPKWHQAEAAPKASKRESRSAAAPNLDPVISAAAIEVETRLPDLGWAVASRKDSANMQPSWYGVSGPFGLLLPGEAADRRWGAAGYAGLAAQMNQSGIMPVLAGPKSLHGFGDEIANETPQLVDLAGKTDLLQLAALAQEAAFFVSDGAEEMQLALAVGCEGVVISPAKAPIKAEGRHIVTMTAPADLGAVEPGFVWRTLINMGLVPSGEGVEGDPRMTAQAR